MLSSASAELVAGFGEQGDHVSALAAAFKSFRCDSQVKSSFPLARDPPRSRFRVCRQIMKCPRIGFGIECLSLRCNHAAKGGRRERAGKTARRKQAFPKSHARYGPEPNSRRDQPQNRQNHRSTASKCPDLELDQHQILGGAKGGGCNVNTVTPDYMDLI